MNNTFLNLKCIQFNILYVYKILLNIDMVLGQLLNCFILIYINATLQYNPSLCFISQCRHVGCECCRLCDLSVVNVRLGNNWFSVNTSKIIVNTRSGICRIHNRLALIVWRCQRFWIFVWLDKPYPATFIVISL